MAMCSGVSQREDTSNISFGMLTLALDKRLWLRPGKKYLMGRVPSKTEPADGLFVIRDHSVSRKHLIIEVARPEEGDAVRTHPPLVGCTVQCLNTDSAWP